tara:strand:+ start:1795 stop:3894 length:2100 start_codon:yes stop_codon:yes gene_type:complete
MEYAGFKKAEGGPVKWGEIATKITGDLATVKEDRQKKRDVIQKTFDTAKKNLDDTPHGQNKNFNGFVIDGADGQRDFRVELAKRIQAGGYKDANGKRVKLSPSTGTQMLQGADSEWSAFAREAKDYNKNFAEMMKRQQKGKDGKPAPGGAFELLLGSQKADLSDLRNKKVITDPDTGRMYLETTDPQGNVTKKSLGSINNNENQLADRVDVSGIIKNQFKNAGDYKVWTKNAKTGKWQMIADQKLRDDFAVLKQGIKTTIMNNDRNIFSVLADNHNTKYTGYVGDKTGDDYKDKMTALTDAIFQEAQTKQQAISRVQAEAEAEKFMIATKEDKMGNTQPEFTAEQRKDAGEYVDHMIDAQAGHSESQPPGVGGGTATGIKKEEKRKLALTIYGDANEAVNTGNFSRFDADFRYKRRADGSIQVLHFDKKLGKFMEHEIIAKQDHKGLSKYHENWSKIDAGFYDAAGADPNAPTAPAYAKAQVYPQTTFDAMDSWGGNEKFQSTEGANLIAPVHKAISEVIPHIKTTDISIGDDVKIAEYDHYGDWAYKRDIQISGKSAGSLIVGTSPNLTTVQKNEIKAHNKKVMKKALELSKGIQPSQPPPPAPNTGAAGTTGSGGATGATASTGVGSKYNSDIALKEDISLVGQSHSGINIYEFKYKASQGRYRGVMAQEVPWASSMAPNGYLQVDYNKVDVDFERL